MVRWLCIGSVAFAIAATISWFLPDWLKQKPEGGDWQVAQQVLLPPQEFDKVKYPYLFSSPQSFQLLTPKFIAIYEEHFPEESDLAARLESTDEALRQASPHLDQALEDPYSTPFLPEDPQLPQTEAQRLSAIVELLVSDYLENSTDSSADSEFTEDFVRTAITDAFINQLRTPNVSYFEKITQSSDPVLLFAATRFTYETSERDIYAKRSHAALSSRKTPAYLRLLIAEHQLLAEEADEEKKNRRNEEYSNALAELLTDPNTPHEMLLTGKRHLRDFHAKIPLNGLLMLCKTLANQDSPKCPTWVLQSAFGYLFKRIAADARGSSWYSKISPENIEIFNQYGQIANAFLLNSWSLNPDNHPLVIEIMRQEGYFGSTGKSTEQWLRYAIELNPSDQQAYSVYSNFKITRWGGSNEELANLAFKIAETASTTGNLEIASLFWVPLTYYGHDEDYKIPFNTQSLSRAATAIGKILKKNPQLPRLQCKNVCFYGAMCAILWESNRFAELHWFMTEYDAECESNGIASFQLDRNLLKAVAENSTDKTRSRWKELIPELFNRSGFTREQSLPQIEELITEIESLSEQKDSRAIQIARKSLEALKSFHSGKPTLLSFDGDMLLWSLSHDLKLNAPTEAIYNFDPNNSFFRMTPHVQFPPPYRVSLIFKNMDDSVIDPYGFCLTVGEQDPVESLSPVAMTHVSHFTSSLRSQYGPINDSGAQTTSNASFQGGTTAILVGIDARRKEVEFLYGRDNRVRRDILLPINGSFYIRRLNSLSNMNRIRLQPPGINDIATAPGRMLIGHVWIEKHPVSEELPTFSDIKLNSKPDSAEKVDEASE